MKKESLPKMLLHLEGFAVLVASLVAFSYFNGNWVLFVVLILAPDLAMLGYLVDTKVGSVSYNVVHTYILPVILFGYSNFYSYFLGIELSLIWIAHIGLDRFFGYGLKYPPKFKDTHLGRV